MQCSSGSASLTNRSVTMRFRPTKFPNAQCGFLVCNCAASILFDVSYPIMAMNIRLTFTATAVFASFAFAPFASATMIESVDSVAWRIENFSEGHVINSTKVDNEKRKRLESRTRRSFGIDRSGTSLAERAVRRRPTSRSVLINVLSRTSAQSRGTLQQVTGERQRRRIRAMNVRATRGNLRSRRENIERFIGRNIDRRQSSNLDRPRVELKFRVQGSD